MNVSSYTTKLRLLLKSIFLNGQYANETKKCG